MNGRLHEITVRTPEGVSFSFRLASPVLRLGALAIDILVILTAWSIASIVIGLLSLVSADFAQATAAIGFFVLSLGYRIGAEWYWQGQTLGKRLLRLRVIDQRGLPLTFAQIVLRNLLRFIDALPFAYAVGGGVAALNSRGQRLGDLAAGTLVVWELAEPAPDLGALRGERYNSLRDHPALTARLRQSIPPALARTAWQALARRDQLAADARLALYAALAGRIRAGLPLPPEVVDGLSDEQFLRNVVDVLFFTRSPAAPRDPAPAPPAA